MARGFGIPMGRCSVGHLELFLVFQSTLVLVLIPGLQGFLTGIMPPPIGFIQSQSRLCLLQQSPLTMQVHITTLSVAYLIQALQQQHKLLLLLVAGE
jgi:hypothetical protein